MIDLSLIKRIVDIEYADIVKDSEIQLDKLRVYLKDGSLVDVWFSRKIEGRFSYLWERRHLDGKIFRHDNFPDPRFKYVASFPKHFHNGFQDKAEESQLSEDPIKGIKEFMDFVKKKMSAWK